MTTLAQVAANRANAQHSTGPASVEGKAASRFNAGKHFIDAESICIPGEDPDLLRQLREDFLEDLRPVGAVETHLVSVIVEAEWFRRRYARIEAELFPAIAKLMEETRATNGELFLKDASAKNVFGKLHRRQLAVKRDLDKAFSDLRRLQFERRKAAIEAAKQAAKAAPVPVTPIGQPNPSPATDPDWVRSETGSLRL